MAFWHGKIEQRNITPPIFKTKKNNLPNNHKPPNGLTMYLEAIKSELMDPKNRNKYKCNIPDDKLKALKDLVTMQRTGQIVMKPCDKGAGIMILNHKYYVTACMDHLNSEQKNHDGTYSRSYEKVEQSKLLEIKDKI